MTTLDFEAHRDYERLDRIPNRVRWAVYERDHYQCQVCGTSGDNRLQLHHWEHWRSHGGTHTEDNLVLVCFQCHEDIHRRVCDISMYRVDGVLRAFVRRPWRRLPR